MTTKRCPPCGNMGCSVSMGIDGSTTFGRGELDDYGYWEIPCRVCAEAWLKQCPADSVWPKPVAVIAKDTGEVAVVWGKKPFE